jgi:hypothetical protein
MKGKSIMIPIEVEPWQLRRAELVPYSSTYPVSHLVDDGPASYSEADLHAYTLWRRLHESEPPTVPFFTVGTWSVDRFEALYQLRRYRLDDPALFFQEGDPFRRDTRWPPQQLDWLIEKYVCWLAAGNEPPPLRGCEMEKGRIRVQDGYHRAAAQVRAARVETLMWVSVAFTKTSGFMTDLTHRIAIEEALRADKPVPMAVLEDYPNLAALMQPANGWDDPGKERAA